MKLHTRLTIIIALIAIIPIVTLAFISIDKTERALQASISQNFEILAAEKSRAIELIFAERINEAEGDVARFNALLSEYSKAPEVTRRRIYIETLQNVLPGIRSKIIVDQETRSILPLLNLDAQNRQRP